MLTNARREDGAAAVEFALIVSVLVLLIFGMLQFGLAFFQLQNLRVATREGARVAAVGGDEDIVRDRVEEASLGAIPANSGAISVDLCEEGNTDLDESAVVTVDLSSGALPASLQDSFTVDIPFMPPIAITAPISGEFRCEGR